MEYLIVFAPPCAFLLAFAISAALDPRKLRTGIYLLTGLLLLAMMLLSSALLRLSTVLPGNNAMAWVLLVLLVLVALSILALGVLLVLNGLTVVRREGRSPAHLLSLVLGAGILVYLVAMVVAVVRGGSDLFAALYFLAFPLGWLGYGLVAYLLWSWLYGLLTARFGRPVDAVIVLGAGLRGREVTQLLGARVERGIEWARRETGRAGRPVLVMSGGKGPDEEVSEAEAMASYAVAHGVDPDGVLLEDRSRTTQENLLNSARLLAARGEVSRVAVVTSSFHAFRAALLMRSLSLPGYAVGAPTARYYRPSAVLREYVAILRDNLWINVVGLALSLVPLVLFAVNSLTS